MGWRKPDVPASANFDEIVEEWPRKAFYWLPVTTLFGKPIGLEEAFNKLISSASKEGVRFQMSPRMLFEQGSFSSKVLVEIENPENYSAQVLFTDGGKVYASECIGDAAHVKAKIERLRKKYENDGYVIQSVYQWYLTDPPWSLNKVSRTVIFIRT